jgi:hypothetical protein
MDFIEDVWVGKERAKAGLRAEIDRPAAVLGAREIGRVGVAEDPTAKRNEVWMLLLFQRI